MSVRRSPTVLSADLRLLLAGAAAAGLLSACGMPQPVEPPPPPEAELEAPTELLGGAEGEMGAAEAYAQAEADANPYADARPAPPVEPGLDGSLMAEAPRPGWGTMDPIPNPPASAPRRSDRAYAEAATPKPYTEIAPDEEGLPRTEERLGAYAAAPTTPYAEPAPVPAPRPYEAAPYAEGTPASAYPPVVIQMQPVPNPPEGAASTPPTRVQQTSTPREARIQRETRSERPAPRRTARVAADERLAGGPARVERPARAAAAASAGAARNTAASATAAPARTGAEARGAAGRPAAQTPAARGGAAPLPPANTPEGRAARLKGIETVLAQLVQRDSTLTVPERIRPGQMERITLTLPQALSETLTREARTAGLRELAGTAELRVDLAGEGWRIEPEEPQTDQIRAGRVASFTWQATPESGAGALTADVDATLQGGGRFETLQLGEITPEIEGAAAPGEEGAGAGLAGLSWRAIGGAVLLLALLIGALVYLRRGGEDSDAGRRRYNRRRPDPVNLTPYSPAADTDAPRDRGPDPEPSRT
jgi:hypothetical protein